MLRSRIIVILYSILMLLIIYTFYNTNKYYTLEYKQDNSISYMSNPVGINVYEITKEPNRLVCNLTTVNTMISNMLKDGYSIIQDLSEDSILDIAISNDENIFRFMYNRETRDCVILSSPFIKNFIPQTYISGGE